MHSKKCIESLRSQLGRIGITSPESMPKTKFTALTDDALGFVSGGTTTFREFNSFTRANTDGSYTFTEVWSDTPIHQTY